MTKDNINIRLSQAEKNNLEELAEELDCSYAGVGSISKLLQLLSLKLQDKTLQTIFIYLLKNVRTNSTKTKSRKTTN